MERIVTFTAFTGIAKGGPLDGRVQTAQSARLPAKGGFYVYVQPSGYTPGGWRWIEDKKGTTK